MGVLEEGVRTDEGQVAYGNGKVKDVPSTTRTRTSKVGVPEV